MGKIDFYKSFFRQCSNCHLWTSLVLPFQITLLRKWQQTASCPKPFKQPRNTLSSPTSGANLLLRLWTDCFKLISYSSRHKNMVTKPPQILLLNLLSSLKVICTHTTEWLVHSAEIQGCWIISILKTQRTSWAFSQGFGIESLLTVFLGRTATNGSMICFYNVHSGKTNYQPAF